MTTDNRFTLYRQLHNYHEKETAVRLYTADRVLRILFPHYQPRSILDVGCGRGAWLRCAHELGISEIRGVEGPWIEGQRLLIDPDKVSAMDLEKPFDLGRKFDLVISIEVAEHIRPECSAIFINSLTKHSDVILFSAAIPFQPGTGHINMAFLDYWAEHFATFGFVPVDCFRRHIWTDRQMQVWIRQNVILFMASRVYSSHAWAADENRNAGPLSIVHPEMFYALMRARINDKLPK